MAKAKYRERLTAAQLRERLHYEPITGVFTWIKLEAACRNTKVGDEAGSSDYRRYIRINILGHLIYAHCLAWLYMTGAWPKDQVDHRNTIRNDNRWENLREVSPASNSQNRRTARIDNSSGRIGVSRHGRKFQARIMVAGKSIYLVEHETPDAAHAAYITAKRELHPGGTL